MTTAQPSGLQSHQVTLAPFTIPEGRMIAPRSFLVDRIAADVEQICLSQSSTGGGQVEFATGPQVFAPPQKRRLNSLRRAVRSVHFDGPNRLLDLRRNSPDNWAHFLTNHLAIVALACRTLEAHWSDFTVVLPDDSPGYLRNLVDLISLPALYTDAAVHGDGVQYNFDKWNVIRGERGALLRDPALNPLAAYLETADAPDPTPKRLFLSRRGTRSLKNETEIESALTDHGFSKLYPEDLEVGLQIRTILHADVIVAVHGAALAPVLYNAPQSRSKKLIELFPVGHITDVYRAAAAECDMAWCGVRGYIEADNLSEIYALGRPYTKHSLNDFRIDPASIKAALDVTNIR